MLVLVHVDTANPRSGSTHTHTPGDSSTSLLWMRASSQACGSHSLERGALAFGQGLSPEDVQEPLFSSLHGFSYNYSFPREGFSILGVAAVYKTGWFGSANNR